MKSYKIISIWTVLVLLIVSSCEDFMDVHKKYTEGGEIIYAPKIDSLEFRAGKNRVYFKFWLRNSPNVENVTVFWDNGLESLIIPVTPSAGLDSMEVFIPDLDEKSYTFDVRTTDKYGHHSLKKSSTASAYGEIFQSTLANRRVGDFLFINGKADISWLSAAETLVRSELRYTDDNGLIQVANVFPDEFSTVLENINASSTYEYRSLFLPEPEAVDTFYTEWMQIYPVALFDKTAWTITASSDAPGWIAQYAIDDNTGTGWHCSWSEPVPPFPHWLVIDMKSVKQVKSINVVKRAGTKTISFELSADGTNWIDAGMMEFPNASDLTQEYIFEEASAQYIRLNFIDGYNGYNVSIWEVSVFGNLSE